MASKKKKLPKQLAILDEDLAVRMEADDGGEESLAMFVGENMHFSLANAGDDRVGRPQIDANDAHTVTLSFFGEP